IQERCRIRAELVTLTLLREQADRGEIVAQDPDATFCRPAARGKVARDIRSTADRRKDIELDARLDRRGAVISGEEIENGFQGHAENLLRCELNQRRLSGRGYG